MTEAKQPSFDDPLVQSCLNLIRRGAAWLTRAGQPQYVERRDLEQIGFLSMLCDLKRGCRKQTTIIRSARTYMLNEIKKASRYSTRDLPIEEPDTHKEQMRKRLDKMDLRRAINALPKQQRDAVFYCDILGFTEAETARITNKEPGSIARYRWLAKKKLSSATRI